MLRAIVHSARSKLPRSLPSFASMVLAALVAAEAFRLAQRLYLLAHDDPDEPDAAYVGPPIDALRRTNIDARFLVAAHLFGIPKPPPVNTDPNAVPASASNLVLTGTLAARNPKRGMAIISQDGKSTFYKVGASLGGAIISSVYRDRIILDRGGTPEALLMPHAKPPGGEPQQHLASVSSDKPSPDYGGLMADNAGSVADVMRTGGPVMNEAGRMRGFRIYPGRDRATFIASGLHGGDVVVAFNGNPVLDQNRLSGQQVFQSFGTATRTTLTIERNGQTREVMIDLAQAGSSMRADPAMQHVSPLPLSVATTDDTTSVPVETHDESP